MDKNEKINLAEWVKDKALKHGADQVTVNINSSRSVEVSYRDKKIEKLQESTESGLSVSIYADHKYSGHSTSDLRKESLEKFIEEAVAGTKYLSADEFRKLPDPKYYPTALDKNLDLTDNNYSKVDTAERVKMAKEIEEAALKVSDKIISVNSGYYDSYYQNVLLQSNGFVGESGGTYFVVDASVSVKDGDGKPEDSDWGSTRFFNEIPSRQEIGISAANRALKKIGQKKVATGKYDMIVENRAASRLLSLFTSAMSARSIQQKSSYLDGMLDKPIASEKLTIIDDPFVQKGFGSKLYDSEGLAVKKRMLIEKGVLKTYLVDNYYGRKTGMEPNSGSLSNILLEYGNSSLADLVKKTKKGILVNGFLGGNNNSTTGDFSFGIVGLLVENGEIVQAVNEMNLSGNSKDFWKQLSEIGNDPNKYSSVKMPSLLFEGVAFSGS